MEESIPALPEAVDLSEYADNIFYQTVRDTPGALDYMGKEFSKIVNSLLGVFSGNDIAVDVGTAATAVGVSLTTLFFCMAMFSEISAFRVERFEEAIRVAMKFIVAKIIIENTSWISGAIYALFVGLSQDGLTEGLNLLATGAPQEPSPTGMEPLGTGLGWLIQVFTYTTPALMMNVFIYATMLLTVAGIVFEIGIHMAVAPIALSTLCNDMTRPTGISFIKSYSAVCIQAFVFGACIKLYAIITPLFENTIDTAQFNLFSGIVGFFIPLIMVLCLTTALKRSSEITKRMLGV
jgi:hypothetical protein